MCADVECIAHSMCKRLGPLWARGKCKVGMILLALMPKKNKMNYGIWCSAYRSNYWVSPGLESKILFQARNLSSRRN